MKWVDYPTVNDDQIHIIPDCTVGMLISCFTSGMDTNNWYKLDQTEFNWNARISMV